MIHRTVGLKQQHPGVQPHQRIGPEGDHDEHNKAGGHLRRLAGDIVRKGIAHQQAQHRGHHGHLKALGNDLEINHIQQRLIAVGAEYILHAAESAPGHKADVNDKEHGDGDEQDHPQGDGPRLCQQGQAAVPLFPAARSFALQHTAASRTAPSPESSWMATAFSSSHQICTASPSRSAGSASRRESLTSWPFFRSRLVLIRAPI